MPPRPRPAEEVPQAPKPKPEPAAEKGPPPASDELGWSGLAQRLQLDSMARQVALNSVVTAWADGRLELGLLPEMELMLKPEIREGIRRAIEAQLGVSLQLEFRSLDRLPCETPYQAARREAEQERQAVIEEIRRDPVVQDLERYFGARLDEDSVRRVDEEVGESPASRPDRTEHH